MEGKMRNFRKYGWFSIVSLLAVASLFLVMSSPAAAQPRPMTQDVYTPIAKGYDLIRDGKYEAAKFQFQTAVKKDPFNPFALNNLAVLEEKAGNLKSALANLKDATKHAAEYKDKVQQTCFVGGGCMAVKPVKAVGKTSSILPIIQENIKKLEPKVKALPPVPSAPPAMEGKPKPKK
jgi:tetratricopeptide (TPR) repeat protein